MEYLKKRLEKINPYHAPAGERKIKLDANESPYALPEALIQHLEQWLRTGGLNRYPDTDSTKLKTVISKAYSLKEENIVCGVGSDQLIDCILRATIEQGEKVVVPYPSFSMYDLTTYLNEGEIMPVPLKEDFTYDIPLLVEVIKEEQPKVIFLCTPNNPTGTILPLKQIKEIAAVATGIVIVDEAYGEFTTESSVSLIETCPNIMIFKTFSKAYGLAGARVGYALGQKQLIQLIEKVKPPYNLNSFSEEAAIWIMENQQVFHKQIESLVRERERVKDALTTLGVKVYPSEANFLWVEEPAPLGTWLKERGIFIKKFTYKDLGNYYRISIGTPTENDQLLAVLAEKLGGIKDEM